MFSGTTSNQQNEFFNPLEGIVAVIACRIKNVLGTIGV